MITRVRCVGSLTYTCVEGVIVHPPLHLWRDLFQTVRLTKNHRQENDTQYTDLLDRVRVGEQNSKDIKILQSRMNVHLSEKKFDTALRIYPTNVQYNEYNSQKLESLLCDTSEKSLIVKAEDVLLNSNQIQPFESEDMLLPEDEQDCGGLPHSLEIVKGMRVMLIKNIDLLLGLVNGAIGTITNIQLSLNNSTIHNNVMPQSVAVQFNSLRNTAECNTNIVELHPVTTKFFGLRNSVWERTQLPLKPCWAAKVHKV